MLLSFPGIVLYGTALFAISDFIKESKNKKTYRILTSFGLTPWLSLHLFYIMILFLFSWLNGNGYADIANACLRGAVQTFVMDSNPQRSIYAYAVYILVLSPNHKENSISEGLGFYKYTFYLCGYVYNKNAVARLTFPLRFYKRTYERKYDNMVCNCFYLGRKMF